MSRFFPDAVVSLFPSVVGDNNVQSNKVNKETRKYTTASRKILQTCRETLAQQTDKEIMRELWTYVSNYKKQSEWKN